MKTNQQKPVLTFGDLIVAAYDAFGKRKAKAIVRLAVNSHVVVLGGRRRVVIS
jgi:hypothetical protein